MSPQITEEIRLRTLQAMTADPRRFAILEPEEWAESLVAAIPGLGADDIDAVQALIEPLWDTELDEILIDQEFDADFAQDDDGCDADDCDAAQVYVSYGRLDDVQRSERRGWDF